jgi:hypothetical protein
VDTRVAKAAKSTAVVTNASGFQSISPTVPIGARPESLSKRPEYEEIFQRANTLCVQALAEYNTSTGSAW